MAQHPLGIPITVLIAAILASALVVSAEEPAYHWQVEANGAKGALDLSVDPGGKISGSLFGNPVEGWLVGRHLVLVREGAGGRETWEAWLATPENVHGDGQPILAGTFLRPGESGPLPWFGTSRSQVAGIETPLPSPLPPEATQREQRPENSNQAAPVLLTIPPSTATIPQAEHPTPEKTQSLPPSTPPPRLPSSQPGLAGIWETPDGPLTIRQDGSKLTFVLPDREVPGRLTGPESVIGGFGPGCCKGHLEQAFAVIAWDNGARWVRK